jgi:hypothetical protein
MVLTSNNFGETVHIWVKRAPNLAVFNAAFCSLHTPTLDSGPLPDAYAKFRLTIEGTRLGSLS